MRWKLSVLVGVVWLISAAPEARCVEGCIVRNPCIVQSDCVGGCICIRFEGGGRCS